MTLIDAEYEGAIPPDNEFYSWFVDNGLPRPDNIGRDDLWYDTLAGAITFAEFRVDEDGKKVHHHCDCSGTHRARDTRVQVVSTPPPWLDVVD